ncbi:Nif3-like dinuclear metal center hexameric protein [Carnobacteriaceae bacterium zg-ZUI252]|nr:Nif3-like dinuclear metal center hexameric protein [Carnobacteriaceae bacterium zg-ZUI252]MBS4770340.1 Nif3-like dinuclear metal center hexameric protein [Carnobacteriaceae bacterium zg-ZUI240]
MKVKEVVAHLETLAPRHLAESWDNVGLLVGDENATVTGVLFTLDVTNEVLDEAIEKGANLIISHHPPLFRGIQTIIATQPQQALFMKAIQNGIHLYAAHTNIDVADGGMNDWLADALALQNVTILHVDGTLDNGQSYGIGRVGRLPEVMTLKELVTLLPERFYTHGVRYVGQDDKRIETVAILGGAGQSYYMDAVKKGADVLITGDTSYHVAQEMADAHLALIDPGHFIEFIFIEKMMAFYSAFAEANGLRLHASTHNSDPYQFRK